jgi:hypothetical protein
MLANVTTSLLYMLENSFLVHKLREIFLGSATWWPTGHGLVFQSLRRIAELTI